MLRQRTFTGSGHQLTASKSFLPQRRGLTRKSADVTKSSFFRLIDPEGESHGTKGARILDLVPNQKLVFEWITFAGDDLLGKNAPPYAPPSERNLNPLPTWVELFFEPVAGQPNQTHVKLAHYGFREGEKWERSYQWFTHAWQGVLDQLSQYCQKQKSNGISKRHDRWWVLTASKIEKESL